MYDIHHRQTVELHGDPRVIPLTDSSALFQIGAKKVRKEVTKKLIRDTCYKL